MNVGKTLFQGEKVFFALNKKNEPVTVVHNFPCGAE